MLTLVIIVSILLWFAARIVHKAGFSRWWCVVALVPIANIVMLWIFAVSDWPSLRKN